MMPCFSAGHFLSECFLSGLSKSKSRAWDHRTRIHVQSRFYDVPGFMQGNSSLNALELEVVGDVKNLSLLHLQCHFGLDTLSWARRGARVTGVDFSPEAINFARSLKEQIQLQEAIDACFVCEDVYQYGENTSQQFDRVFTSYGVLCWLPDMMRWAECIARLLKPGGKLNLIEFHPVHDLLMGYNYFHKPDPDDDEEATYTENCPGEKNTMLSWPHSMGEVVNALIKAGLVIEHLQEYPSTPYDCFEGLEKHPDGYQKTLNGKAVPLVSSIQALKP